MMMMMIMNHDDDDDDDGNVWYKSMVYGICDDRTMY